MLVSGSPVKRCLRADQLCSDRRFMGKTERGGGSIGYQYTEDFRNSSGRLAHEIRETKETRPYRSMVTSDICMGCADECNVTQIDLGMHNSMFATSQT